MMNIEKRKAWAPKISLGRWIACVLAAFALGVMPEKAGAQTATIAFQTDTILTLDSNNPCTSGPRSAFIQARVTNSGATTLNPIRAVVRGLTTGTTSLSGGQDSAQFLAPLAAGASVDVYWFVQYPCTFGTRTAYTVVVDDGAGTTYGTMASNLTTAAMISAQAGGNLVAQSLTATTLGAITYISVQYTFGGANIGDKYSLQPAGNSIFNAGCFQLLGSLVTQSIITAIPNGTVNKLNFTAAVRQSGTNQTVTVQYKFRSQCSGIGTVAKPYAYMTSGSSNLKYSGNFDTWGSAGETTVGGGANPFTVMKTGTPDTLSDGGIVTYTVAITNGSAQASSIDSIADVLPSGVTYGALHASSGVTVANSRAVPASGASGRIVWYSVAGTYYTVAAGATLNLVYTTNISAAVGSYTNTASGFVAKTLAGFDTAKVTVRRMAEVGIGKTGPSGGMEGDTLRFIITVTNNGPSAARSVVVTDTLPVQLEFVSATRGGVYSGGVITWAAIDSLPVGATEIDTVFAKVIGAGSVVNISATSSPRLDSIAANNNGSAEASRVNLTLLGGVIVQVTPDGVGVLRRLAGGSYSQTFTVDNGSGRTETFDLVLTTGPLAGSFIATDSLKGPGIAGAVTDSARVSAVAGPQIYTAWYSVAAGDTAVNQLVLWAKSVVSVSVKDTGWVDIRRAWPALTLAKTVAAIGDPIPGQDIEYQIQFANAGEMAAMSTVIEDDVPAQLFFKVGSIAMTLPGGVTGVIAYSSNGGSTWTYAPVSGGCGAIGGYDGCVNKIRLTLSGDLPADVASSSGLLTFRGKIK